MGEAEPGPRVGHAPGYSVDLVFRQRSPKEAQHLVCHFAAPSGAADRWRHWRCWKSPSQDASVAIDASKRVGVHLPETPGVGDQGVPGPVGRAVEQGTDQTAETGPEVFQHHQSAAGIAGEKHRAVPLAGSALTRPDSNARSVAGA